MEILVLLAVLVCPIVMGGAMLWMALKMRTAPKPTSAPTDDEP